MSEQNERDAMIAAARDFMSNRDYAEAHDALVYEPPAGWEAQMLINHFAEFAMDQTADLREQLRVAREALEWYEETVRRLGTATIDAKIAKAQLRVDGGDIAREALARIDGDTKEQNNE